MSDNSGEPRHGTEEDDPTRPGRGYDSGGARPGQGHDHRPPPASPYGSGGYGAHGGGHPGPQPPPGGAYGRPAPGLYGQAVPDPYDPYGQAVPDPYDPYGQAAPGPYGAHDPYARPAPGFPEPYGPYDPYGRHGRYGSYGPRPGTDDTTLAMVSHLLGLLTGFLGPLVMYLVKRDESPYVRDQAAEALNFQLTLMIAYVVASVLMFVFVGFLLLPLIWIGSVVFMVLAAVAANRGESYRYPMSVRFVS
ncbi:hypothetical protein Ppa06_29930 [Planomonospora parontospora subsp. parontospora]|uniref:DUF4870 domain-containing protein n=2 Tax=Planomonospora parontospora TaxID=58119 RepID=A0AA37BHK3_9ACTN|nr:DUF4870 domain-containing protein [Planomonospora parontospora]GGK71735.1 hypothetical protein GCM10010126_34020 [Planomonospora parontospora]GII09195.1 hypothetical protein Ppa06_29930 [Planomonospora parontospora subsp. parontospora]